MANTMDNQQTARNTRKELVGRVVSNKMQKSVVVRVERRQKHNLYGKFITRTSRFKAHDEQDEANEGDLVQLMETRPLSKNKRWRLVKILERAK
jgi:small subunit ribosomal protein S17